MLLNFSLCVRLAAKCILADQVEVITHVATGIKRLYVGVLTFVNRHANRICFAPYYVSSSVARLAGVVNANVFGTTAIFGITLRHTESSAIYYHKFTATTSCKETDFFFWYCNQT